MTEHNSLQDFTTAEVNEVKDLYTNLMRDVENLQSIDSIVDKLRHISCYEVKNDDLLDVLSINVVTDNKEPNSIAGVVAYIDKEDLSLSRFVDVCFNDEEYLYENYEVRGEQVWNTQKLYVSI